MITSPQNKQIKDAQKLQRKRRRTEAGLLLIEGQRLIQDALGANVTPQTIFYTREFEDKNSATTALIQELSTIKECHLCTMQAINALSDTVTPQGIVAVVPQPKLPLPETPTLTLILDQVRDPGNVGTLLRSAEAAGVDQVLFAPNTADPFNEKVMRAAMGAHFRLPIRVYETFDALWTYIECTATSIDDNQSTTSIYIAEANAALTHEEVDWNNPSALIVGGEAAGASADAVDAAIAISIPMHGNTESLNAGVAGSVILFEAARQRRHAQ